MTVITPQRCAVRPSWTDVHLDEVGDVTDFPTVDEELAISSPRSRTLLARAHQLRRDANVRLAPLADALRRRAAELELQAFVLDNAVIRVPPTSI